MSEYSYNGLGQLSGKSYHNASADSLYYTYNVRGWLTGIYGEKFVEGVNYSGLYNGNIRSINWGTLTNRQSYTYIYDGLSRLTEAIHSGNRFNEKVTEYDKNGNIKKLQRYGQTGASSYGLVDNLTYTYNGNQLTKVEDAVTATSYTGGTNFINGASTSNEYVYDQNGNLTKDLNKNISNIQYNSLNLPSIVTFSDGSTITYTYTHDGKKLRTVHVIGGVTTTTDYCGNVIYENGTAKRLLHEEGYVDLTSNTYYYYLKDHQGNNRVVINSSGTVQETNHYYPFGGLFSTSTNVQPYKYNGKELDTKKGLNLYDYGARHYDAALGRWHAVDPMTENYLSLGSYAYCANNPTLYIDIDGRDWFYYADNSSAEPTWHWHEGSYYNTGVKDLDGNYIILTGAEAVVVFDGYYDETLDINSGMNESLGAKLADVTVYGPNGSDDIEMYKGYTMSSDPNVYGVVANGIYDVRRLKDGERKGPYDSKWVVNNRGRVPALYGWNPAYPERDPGYLVGVFIHRNNWNGFAGRRFDEEEGVWKAVSEGCLLITSNQWNAFENQLKSVTNLKLQINRR